MAPSRNFGHGVPVALGNCTSAHSDFFLGMCTVGRDHRTCMAWICGGPQCIRSTYQFIRAMFDAGPGIRPSGSNSGTGTSDENGYE